jgi:hypothetical protein
MTKHLALLLGLLVALLAACGGDDDEKATTGTKAAQRTATEAAPRAAEQSSRQGVANAREQSIETCKRRITKQPGMSAQLRADLEGLCEEGASGDENRRREAAEKVCRRLVEESAPPGASARGPLMKNCEQPPAR